MMLKVLLVLCPSALINAGVIETDNSTPHVIYNTPTGYTKITQSPVYQTILTTKESNYESPDGIQRAVYTKSLNTAYSSSKKYEPKSTEDGDVVANTVPGIYSTAAHSPVVYHHRAAYSLTSPLVHTDHTPALTKYVSVPISYATHDVPLTKTIVSPTSVRYSTPVFEQTKYVTSGLSSYSSHTPVIESQPIKTTITYSQAPLVSHMSFTGLGATYAW